MPVSVDAVAYREREKGQQSLREGGEWGGCDWATEVIVSQTILIKNWWIKYHHQPDNEGVHITFYVDEKISGWFQMFLIQ